MIRCCTSFSKQHTSPDQLKQHTSQDQLTFSPDYKPMVREKIYLKNLEDIQTTSVEETTSSHDVADEEQIFFTQAAIENESEEQTLQRGEQERKEAKDWISNEEPSSLKTSFIEITNTHGNTTSYSINGIKVYARTRIKQHFDLI